MYPISQCLDKPGHRGLKTGLPVIGATHNAEFTCFAKAGSSSDGGILLYIIVCNSTLKYVMVYYSDGGTDGNGG